MPDRLILSRRWMAALCAVLLGSAGGAADRAGLSSGLPPEAVALEMIDTHPAVLAATARIDAARARRDMLARGPYEIEASGGFDRRTVDGEGRHAEYEAALSRPFRLPGKAALDRRAGALDVAVAEGERQAARHRTALLLSALWHDWLAAAGRHRNELAHVASLEQAVAAVRRQVALGDAAALDLDRALAALSAARAVVAGSRAGRDAARIRLAAAFPALPLPAAAPDLAAPQLPGGADAAVADDLGERIVAHSHALQIAGHEAERLETVARRLRADRLADPTFGVRLFSERGGDRARRHAP